MSRLLSISTYLAVLFLGLHGIQDATAFSATAPKLKRKIKTPKTDSSKASSLVFDLQKCFTPVQVLTKVGSQLSHATDRDGSIASLALVRLSKQLLTLQNEYLHRAHLSPNGDTCINWKDHVEKEILLLPEEEARSSSIIMGRVIETLALAQQATTSNNMETVLEGTKATAVLARLLPDTVTYDMCQPLLQFWEKLDNVVVLEDYQLSGLHWAYSYFHHVFRKEESQELAIALPPKLQQAYDRCHLPFFFLPGYFEDISDLTVANLVRQVPFQVDAIKTTSTKQVVPERRETAWLGDEGVEAFRYSGKSMPRHGWSPLVQRIRDALSASQQHPMYYDGCLLNHYPDGGSAMRYHIDPDQGHLWNFTTAVVSVGASRRVAFRTTDQPPTMTTTSSNNKDKKENGNAPTTKTKKKAKAENEKPHTFVVMHGDVMVMVDDCQSRFQHAVKPADNKQEQAARASLVFKQTLPNRRRDGEVMAEED